MILAFDRRILLDAADRKLLGIFLKVEPPSAIEIAYLRAIVDEVVSTPPEHVGAKILHAMAKDFLAEAEALFKPRQVH